MPTCYGYHAESFQEIVQSFVNGLIPSLPKDTSRISATTVVQGHQTSWKIPPKMKVYSTQTQKKKGNKTCFFHKLQLRRLRGINARHQLQLLKERKFRQHHPQSKVTKSKKIKYLPTQTKKEKKRRKTRANRRKLGHEGSHTK